MKIATLVLQTIAIAALAGCATVSKPGYDTLIAHRGESKDAPENTLPAYKLAVERGFGFECDLYLSKDGRVFTFHDPNLTRTTGGANTSKCSEASWEETLSKLDVGSWGEGRQAHLSRDQVRPGDSACHKGDTFVAEQRDTRQRAVHLLQPGRVQGRKGHPS